MTEKINQNKAEKPKNSFIFYRSFFEAIYEVKNEEKLQIYEAISNYALNKIEPTLKGTAKAIFILIKPQLDANNKRYENGKKGGRPKTKPEPKHNQTITKPEPNKNVNVNDNDNKNNSISLNDYKSVIPTFEEIKKYERERKVFVNCRRFQTINALNQWKRAKEMGEWKGLFDLYAEKKENERAKTKNEVEEIKKRNRLLLKEYEKTKN